MLAGRFAAANESVANSLQVNFLVVIDLLTDTPVQCSPGCGRQVMKSMPHIDESRKRKAEGGPTYGKKSKTDSAVTTALLRLLLKMSTELVY